MATWTALSQSTIRESIRPCGIDHGTITPQSADLGVFPSSAQWRHVETIWSFKPLVYEVAFKKKNGEVQQHQWIRVDATLQQQLSQNLKVNKWYTICCSWKLGKFFLKTFPLWTSCRFLSLFYLSAISWADNSRCRCRFARPSYIATI